jgi:hypothetical protein
MGSGIENGIRSDSYRNGLGIQECISRTTFKCGFQSFVTNEYHCSNKDGDKSTQKAINCRCPGNIKVLNNILKWKPVNVSETNIFLTLIFHIILIQRLR